MIDRGNVIKAIEICYTVGHNCTECPLFNGGECNDRLMQDALALLKEQEYARCGNCQFRDFGENEVGSWDRCKLHRRNTSPDEYCSWFVERAGEVDAET